MAEPEETLRRLKPIAGRVARRLRDAGRKGRTATLKLKSQVHPPSTG